MRYFLWLILFIRVVSYSQVFWNFPAIFSLLTSSLIPLWSESRQCMIPIFFKYVKDLLWYGLECGPSWWISHVSLRRMCILLLLIYKSEVAQLCPTLCHPMDCSPPGSSVHGILQARVLEWVAISSSRGTFQPRDRTQVSCVAGRRFTFWATREAPSVQFSSVQSLSRVRLFATPWSAARQASLSITNSRSSLKLMSVELVMPSSHLILCRPLLLLPPIPPSIRVFSNELTLCMRWPKYWSFSFSISSSKETPGTDLL